jgi:hypothetical protein
VRCDDKSIITTHRRGNLIFAGFGERTLSEIGLELDFVFGFMTELSAVHMKIIRFAHASTKSS